MSDSFSALSSLITGLSLLTSVCLVVASVVALIGCLRRGHMAAGPWLLLAGTLVSLLAGIVYARLIFLADGPEHLVLISTIGSVINVFGTLLMLAGIALLKPSSFAPREWEVEGP